MLGVTFLRVLPNASCLVSSVSGIRQIKIPPSVMIAGDTRIGSQTKWAIIAEATNGATASARRTAHISNWKYVALAPGGQRWS